MKRVVFGNFAPKEIIIAVEKIQSDEVDIISISKLSFYIKKILNGQSLQEDKLRKIFLNMSEVLEITKEKKEYDQNLFKINLLKEIEKLTFKNENRWILAMRYSLLSTYNTEFHNSLKYSFNLKKYGNLNLASKANKYINEYIESKLSMREFYSNKISYILTEKNQIIDSIYEELGIETTSNLYYDTIIPIIGFNLTRLTLDIKDTFYTEEFIKIINSIFSEKDVNVIFKSILNEYFNRKTSPRDYNDLWFNYMYKTNRGLDHYKWSDYSKFEKLVFKKWLNNKNIKDFFENHAIYPDRKEYWYDWIDLIEEAEIIEEFKKALIMSFKDHLIIEFGEVGAIRVYPKDELSIREIRSLFENHAKTRAIIIVESKYKESSNSRWYHQGSWQFKFDYSMGELGYRR